MRESRTYGSVRGARGNSRPYREDLANCARRLLHCISTLMARTRCAAMSAIPPLSEDQRK